MEKQPNRNPVKVHYRDEEELKSKAATIIALEQVKELIGKLPNTFTFNLDRAGVVEFTHDYISGKVVRYLPVSMAASEVVSGQRRSIERLFGDRVAVLEELLAMEEFFTGDHTYEPNHVTPNFCIYNSFYKVHYSQEVRIDSIAKQTVLAVDAIMNPVSLPEQTIKRHASFDVKINPESGTGTICNIVSDQRYVCLTSLLAAILFVYRSLEMNVVVEVDVFDFLSSNILELLAKLFGGNIPETSINQSTVQVNLSDRQTQLNFLTANVEITK